MNSKFIIVGAAGVILGVILNSAVRNWENRGIFKALLEEKNRLENKSKSENLDSQEKQQLNQLISEIYLMKFRCKI